MKNVIKTTTGIMWAVLLWFLVAVVLSLAVTVMAECLIFIKMFRASVRDYLAYAISIVSVLVMVAVSLYSKYSHNKIPARPPTRRRRTHQ